MKRSLQVPHVGHKAPIPLGARRGPLICSSAIAGKDPADGSLPADGALQVAEDDQSNMLHNYLFYRSRTIAGGTSEVQKNVIARELFGA